ncbi:MAG TPA: hypothetical protein VL201_04090, partial [Patescibacteria group bacterium]|nr:hypothetical protein [Patescibacteria group bacterium]
NVPLRLMVLQKIKQLNDVNNRDNIQKLYADLGFVLRLFFTDLHGRDMLSLTENEMIHHIDDCALCAESFSYVKKNALLHEWRAEIRQLLERTSDVKYKAELNEHTESIKNDISFVTTVVQSVYFKK